jgi:hypothetical protein
MQVVTGGLVTRVALVVAAGDRASIRFLEFSTANVRNLDRAVEFGCVRIGNRSARSRGGHSIT